MRPVCVVIQDLSHNRAGHWIKIVLKLQLFGKNSTSYWSLDEYNGWNFWNFCYSYICHAVLSHQSIETKDWRSTLLLCLGKFLNHDSTTAHQTFWTKLTQVSETHRIFIALWSWCFFSPLLSPCFSYLHFSFANRTCLSKDSFI